MSKPNRDRVTPKHLSRGYSVEYKFKDMCDQLRIVLELEKNGVTNTVKQELIGELKVYIESL